MSILTLLLAEGFYDVINCLQPDVAKDSGIARYQPIPISQARGIAQRVDLVLTLKNILRHPGHILLPTGTGRTIVKGIRVPIYINTLQLAQNHTTQHLSEFLILGTQLHVRPYLSPRIAQPHGRNIAGIYKGIILAIYHTVMHGRFQGIGKAVGKHPSQSWIATE